MTIAELIEALNGLDPSLQVVVRDVIWDGVRHIEGIYDTDGVVEIEVGEGGLNAQE